MNRARVFIFMVFVLSVGRASAQDAVESVIADNSFFIEEAYNQEAGVVQYISNILHFSEPARTWSLSETYEFPLRGQRHQGSFTIPFLSTEERNRVGIGDVGLHYRYQLILKENGAAASPRFSVFIPTGDEDDGRGFGTWAIQINGPVSFPLGPALVAHANVGWTFIPSHEIDIACVDQPGVACPTEADALMTFNLGGSIVWLVMPTFNVLVEVLNNQIQFEKSLDKKSFTSETVINPAVRFAINSGSLQIVPGFGVPIRMSEGETNVGVFGYLSFEHPL